MQPQWVGKFAVRALAASVLCVASGCIVEADVLEEPGVGPGPGDAPIATLTELYADDPLRQTLDFESGDYGLVLGEGDVFNKNSHLDYGRLQADGFTAGVQGNEGGAIVDLGPDAELAQQIGARESGFASLELGSDGFGYPPADALFDEEQEASAAVVQDHVYVIRVIRDEGEIIVKALVADHTPERRVVIDWVRLK
jgi:hypothetical protein